MAASVRAQMVYWTNGAANGSWSSTQNWSNGALPSSGNAVALTGNYVAAAQSITLSGAVAIGGLTTSSEYNYTLTGGTITLNGNLTMAAGAAAASLTIGSGLSLGSAVTVTNQNVTSGNALNLNGAVNLGAFTLGFGGGGANTTVNGVVSGTGGLTLDSTGGTVTLAGANTYTGATTVNGGTLQVGSFANGGAASNLGASSNAAGNLVLNGGTLRYTGATAVSTDRLFTLGTAGGTIDSGAGFVNGVTFSNTGAIALAGTNTARTLTLTGDNQASVNRRLQIVGYSTLAALLGDNGTGATSVVKSGTGMWSLSGNNTYTGATTINGGALLVTSLASGGQASNLGAASNAARNLILDGGGLIYAGAATSTDRLFSIGTGGGFISNAGSGPINFTNTGGVRYNGQSGPRTLTLASGNNGANTLAAFIGDNGGATAVTKVSTGTWLLTGNNTYSGLTTVSGGILQIGSGGTTGAISGDALVNATLAFARSDAVTYAGIISGTGNLVQAGAGALTLTGGSAAFTGTTDVTSGTLKVNGSLAGSAVTVRSGATLGGSGTVGAATFLSGSVLAPGNSPGLLTAGNTVWNGGTTYQWQLANAAGPAGTGWDELAVNGTLTLSATAQNPILLSLSTVTGSGAAGAAANFNAGQNATFLIASTTGGISGFSSSAFSLDASGVANTPAGNWAVVLDGNNLDLAYTAAAVPEPGSTAVLAGLGAGLLAAWRRRRRGGPAGA